MTKMTRRNFVRLVSFSIFALAVLFGLAISGVKSTTFYKNQLEINYRQSLTELDECLDMVNTDLTKSLYSNSHNEIYNLSRDLYAQCATAKNAISRLPIEQMELGNAYKFLSQASDYAQYIGSKIEKGEKISEKEHKNLRQLMNYAQKFANSTREMVAIAESGGRITDNEVSSTKTVSASALANSFSTGAKTFDDFPTLLYDGPFSDQVLNKKSEIVKNAKAVSKEDCRKIAARAIDVSVNRMIYESDEKGKMPCYTFQCGRYTVSVTKQGGFVRNIIYSGSVQSSNITMDNATNLAMDHLKNLGYDNMVANYCSVSDNVCTVNCAYKSDGVICYSELIKVGISMESGELLTLDSTTYLTNHTKRKVATPKISEKQAMAKISQYLNPKSAKQCIIPKENGTEVQCYEITCESKETGEKALVYINCTNGEEEDIMLLLETDGGTMTK